MTVQCNNYIHQYTRSKDKTDKIVLNILMPKKVKFKQMLKLIFEKSMQKEPFRKILFGVFFKQFS